MTASHAPYLRRDATLRRITLRRRALRSTSLSVYARDCLTVNLYDCLLREIQSVFVSAGVTDTDTESCQVNTRVELVWNCL